MHAHVSSRNEWIQLYSYIDMYVYIYIYVCACKEREQSGECIRLGITRFIHYMNSDSSLEFSVHGGVRLRSRDQTFLARGILAVCPSCPWPWHRKPAIARQIAVEATARHSSTACGHAASTFAPNLKTIVAERQPAVLTRRRVPEVDGLMGASRDDQDF